jgi:transcriptional activator of cad operon
MERSTTARLRVGDWCVDPASSQISRDEATARLETRTMRLLLRLAEQAGEVVSIDELLNHVWPEVNVTPDSVYQAVASLRRLLGDDPKQATYIASVPRLGYRMVAPVSAWEDSPAAEAGASPAVEIKSQLLAARSPRFKTALTWTAAGSMLGILFAVALLFYGRIPNPRHPGLSLAPPPPKSVAVLPFLDLTEGMDEEPFSDGMTEELIDKLSKVPGLRVPAPTSSFYFKGKQLPMADIARSLGVVYLLDGSVRK